MGFQPRHFLSRAARPGAFTLSETLISLLMITLISAGVISSLLHFNRFAASERNQSNAREICQGRIDQILTAPFSAGSGSRAPILAAGVTNETDVPIYIERNSNVILVRGTRSTRIETLDAALNVLRATVTVNYTFRSRPYSYELYTLRSAD